jgi:hypothetical protein
VELACDFGGCVVLEEAMWLGALVVELADQGGIEFVESNIIRVMPRGTSL